MGLQMLSSCETLVSDSPTMRELRAHTYDVMVIDALDYCSLGVAHILRINATVWMSPAMMFEGMAWYAGMPIESAYIPSGEYVCVHTHQYFRSNACRRRGHVTVCARQEHARRWCRHIYGPLVPPRLLYEYVLCVPK